MGTTSDPDKDPPRLPQDGATSDASAADLLEGQHAVIAGVMLAAAACALTMPRQSQPPGGHTEVIADQLDPGTEQPAPVDHAVTADDQPTAIGQSPPVDGDLSAGVMLAAASCALTIPLQFQPPSGHTEVIADQLDPGTYQPAPVDHAVTTDDQPTAIGQSPPVDGDLSAPTDNAVNVDEPPTKSDHPSPVDAAQSTPGPDADPSTSSVDAHVGTANEAEMSDLQKVHASMEAPRRPGTRSLDKITNNGDG